LWRVSTEEAREHGNVANAFRAVATSALSTEVITFAWLDVHVAHFMTVFASLFFIGAFGAAQIALRVLSFL